MALISRTLELGRKAFAALLILVGLIALWMWVSAILAWGAPGAFAEAVAWTVFTLLVLAPLMTIEWAQARGA